MTTSGGSSADTTYLVLAYRDPDAHTVILAFYDRHGALTGEAGVMVNDTLTIGPSAGSGSTSRTSLGGTCTPFSSSLTNPILAEIGSFTCTLASFQTTTSLMLPSAPGVDPALTSLLIAECAASSVHRGALDAGPKSCRGAELDSGHCEFEAQGDRALYSPLA